MKQRRAWKQAKLLYKKGRRLRKRKPKQALLLLRRAYRLLLRVCKPSHPFAMRVMAVLELTYYRLGMYHKSLAILKRQLLIRTRRLPKGHPKLRKSMRNIALLYTKIGKHKQAIRMYQRVLRLLQERYKVTHPRIAKLLYYIGSTYTKLGQYKKARRLLTKALALQQKALGPKHVQVGHTHNSLGILHHKSGQYEQAIGQFVLAYQSWKARWGTNHGRIAYLWHSIGIAQIKLERFAKAKASLERALAIRKKRYVARHPLIANTYNDLGILSTSQGKFARGLSFFRVALKSQRHRLGATHPHVLTMQHNLALIFARMGLYQEARKLAKQVLAMRKQALGPTHPHVAFDLATMARILRWEGSYQKALLLLEQALALRLKRLGESHFFVAQSRLELAQLRMHLAQYGKAQQRLAQALAPANIRRNHTLFVAKVLQLQADIATQKGQSPRALRLLKQALRHFHAQPTGRHPEVALIRSKMGQLLVRQGKLARSQQLQEAALLHLQKQFKGQHPWVALVLTRLAALYAQQGQTTRGIASATKAIRILETTLGPTAQQLVPPLQLLARFYARMEQSTRAMGLIQRAWHVQWQSLEEVFALASTKQRLQYLRTIDVTRDLYTSIALKHPATAQSKVAWLRQVWQSKGLLFRLAQAQQTGAAKAQPQAKHHHKWRLLRRQIARLAWRGPTTKTSQGWKRWSSYLQTLRRKRNAFERAHHNNANARTFINLRRNATLAHVLARLKTREALVEFVRYTKMVPTKTFQARPLTVTHYLAFVIRPLAGLQVIDLGPAGPITQAIRSLRHWMPRIPAKYLGGPRRALGKLKPANDLLLRRVWKPLLPYLKGTRHIFLSPDGALTLLPFEILRRADGHYLVESHSISYLIHGLELVSLLTPQPARKKPKPKTTIDATQGLKQAPRQAPKASSTLRQCRSLLLGDPAFGTPNKGQARRFSQLQGSRVEIVQAAKALGGKSLLGKQASKVRLLQQLHLRPDLVHIATHGFFLSMVAQRRQPLFPHTRKGQPLPTKSARQYMRNPLLRSGFALAGANHGRGKGIVSALEISSLSLGKTALVVLSACDTGIGASNRWQGIQGLRSAFVHAGVQSLILGLWKIPDRETAALMGSFYDRLRRGRRRYKAFRDAQLHLIQRLRAAHGVAHPFYWGAFVFQGTPRVMARCAFPAPRQDTP